MEITTEEEEELKENLIINYTKIITGDNFIALFMVAIFFLLSVFERIGEGTLPLPVLAYMFM